MSQGDLTELMKKAQEVQNRMREVQQDLARRTIEGSAGGGMVTAVATGELRIREIKIEPSLLEPGSDQAMMQDLVAAAVNAALGNAQRMVQEELQRVAAQNPIAFGQMPGPGQGQGQ